ncbi:MAG: putative porin, partial [Burkholderiales bacterium]
MNRPHRRKRLVAVLLATGLISASFTAHGEERDDLERLRATVLSLVDTLVKNGILTQDKADAMMRDAESMAKARLTQLPPEFGPDGKKIVRVPYIPESVKTQLRDQVKAEVAAQTKEAHAAAGGLGDLGQSSRFKVSGDVTLRAQMNRLAGDNTPASSLYSSTIGSSTTLMTRGPNLLNFGGATNIRNIGNTQEDYNLMRVRARVGVDVDVASNVTASLAVTTGSNTSAPGSDFQTLGGSAGNNYFDKYSLV